MLYLEPHSVLWLITYASSPHLYFEVQEEREHVPFIFVFSRLLGTKYLISVGWIRHSLQYSVLNRKVYSPHTDFKGSSDSSQRRTSAVLREYWLLSSILSQSRDICGGNVTVYQCLLCPSAQMCSCFLGGKVREQKKIRQNNSNFSRRLVKVLGSS